MATEIRQFQGVKIGRQGPSIFHLFFADDSLFFFEASTEACMAVNNVITRFCDISGQFLNLQKSFVKFIPNTPVEDQSNYRNILRMSSKPSLGVYLGVPIDIQDTKVQHFTPLLDTISQRISRWNHKTISQSGKLVIINLILVASIMHHLVSVQYEEVRNMVKEIWVIQISGSSLYTISRKLSVLCNRLKAWILGKKNSFGESTGIFFLINSMIVETV